MLVVQLVEACKARVGASSPESGNFKHQPVRKSYRAGLLLLLLLPLSPANAGVDCNGVPHTRLELAVCGEPVLRALDTELTAAFKEAQQRELVDQQLIEAQRNQVARQCQREPSMAFNACLLDAELKSLEWVASKLGQFQGTGSSIIDRAWRYDASLAARASFLKKQLAVAESRLQSADNPELTVLTILSLLSVYEELQSPPRNVVVSVDKLEFKLASGCHHVRYAKQWRKLLVENNRACDSLRSLTLYSASDF